jgi:organic hydroperoxide reductase OsmC/OhrA
MGEMSKNDQGIPWVSAVTLNPWIVYSGDRLPAPADEERLHHLAHEQCFIANSIKTQVQVVPRSSPGG